MLTGYNGAYNKLQKVEGQIHKKAAQCNSDFFLLNRQIEKISQSQESNIQQFSAKIEKTGKESVGIIILYIFLSMIWALIITILISRNLKKIMNSLLHEIDSLMRSAISGDLRKRADLNKVNKEFMSIPAGVNNTLDAVIAPMNKASVYFETILFSITY